MIDEPKLPIPHPRGKLPLAMACLSCSIALAPHANASVLIEEVVVTAQKREQNLQDVGISVTAFSGDQLRELGYKNSTDIAQQTPGLNYIQSHPTLTTINIRGISQNDFADHLEPPIAMVVDNAYVSSMGAASAQLFDIERVEVLRGPQGTLFGRNATGGLLHYVSVKPSQEVEGYLSATAGNYKSRQLEGAIGGGLTENLAGRVSFAMDKNDGYLENRIGENLRDTDAQALRVQLAWDAGENSDVLLKLHHAKNDSRGNGYDHSAAFANEQGLGVRISGPDWTGYEDTDNDPHVGSYDDVGFFRREINGTTLEVVHQLGEQLTLTSVTDYMRMHKDYREDADSGPNAYFHFETGQDFKQFSQEVRLNGELESLRWQAGLYYLDIRSDSRGVFDLDNFPFGVGSDFGEVVNVGGHNTVLDTNSWAIFGQTDFDLSDELTATLGLRYTEDTRDVNYDGFDNFDTGNQEQRKRNFNNVSYKAQLDWRPTDETLLFASVTQTHKAGNYRLGIGSPNLLTPHDQEELLSYELGIKTEMMDGRLRLNATAFYYDYSDYQAFVVDPTVGVAATLDIINVDADAKGAELEIIASPIEGLDILFGATWMDSTVKDVNYPDGTVSDSELPYAPTYSLNGLLRYQWSAFDGTMAAQIDFNFSDDFCFSVFCAPLDQESSYLVSNARVSYDFPSGDWGVSAFVSNLGDEEYRVYALDLAGLGLSNSSFAAPRTYGISVDYTF
ncbi:TonB-dependent receptor [Pseudoteredinibacter isoporae]|uniref:Iron complex outermembrane receptor protein n=1 Tax=Pseudoteredinibacter isoporae TaxID=570281 RepID=A0A7X0JRT3_9GAMM|nr:TonB-dependent receptor [Pseudoteredinibacter isoporae]MBB6520221.1 iron complex outermembrane receptor protein [Pseudoteredinibacter isoporae]NHO85793.1 TonB-dependent receptor [Pseudoteredinibacter isoporae]NIB25755.1 TonB-dependent receptor [Pseudoteredinibacter isoporae]